MKLLLGLAAFLLVISTSWVYFSSPPSRASTGTNIYVPLVIQGWMEKVAIVQRDGHQAVYWPSTALLTTPYYPPPTPVPGGIPVYLEVENHTGRNIAWVTVEIQALDSSGAFITQTATLIDVLRPGQRSPVAFNVLFTDGYRAFQAASKGFTVLPDWSYTDWDSQTGLQIGWGYPYQPPPSPYATPTPSVPTLPNITGWVKNTGTSPVTGASVVVIVRGNEQAHGLVLEAAKVPIYGTIYPGSWSNFYVSFNRDYGSLFGSVEAVAQRRLDIPGILEASSW